MSAGWEAARPHQPYSLVVDGSWTGYRTKIKPNIGPRISSSMGVGLDQASDSRPQNMRLSAEQEFPAVTGPHHNGSGSSTGTGIDTRPSWELVSARLNLAIVLDWTCLAILDIRTS